MTLHKSMRPKSIAHTSPRYFECHSYSLTSHVTSRSYVDRRLENETLRVKSSAKNNCARAVARKPIFRACGCHTRPADHARHRASVSSAQRKHGVPPPPHREVGRGSPLVQHPVKVKQRT